MLPPLLVGVALAAATALVAIRDPHQGGYPLCPVLAVTGFACAGCGGLRAAHDLATLDVAGAWSMNPMATIALPLLALAWLVWLIRAVRRLPPVRVPVWVGVASLTAVLAFSVLRNVPMLQPYLGPA